MDKDARVALLERVETKVETVEPQPKVEEKPKQIQNTLNLKELKKENFYSSTVIETPNYDFIESTEIPDSTPKAQPKKDPKIRLRIILIAYSIIFLICTTWIICNAVNINGLNSSINQANNAYSINEAKYIYQISKLDDVTPDEDGSISPIDPENIFGVQPEKLADPTSAIPDTNWFDKLCNWISKIFGG